MGRQPKLVTAVFTSLSSPDPAAVGCQQQITLLMEGIISRAMGERDVPDMADRARMIGHVWYSALVGWVNGWSTMARRLRRAGRVGAAPAARSAGRATHTGLTWTFRRQARSGD